MCVTWCYGVQCTCPVHPRLLLWMTVAHHIQLQALALMILPWAGETRGCRRLLFMYGYIPVWEHAQGWSEIMILSGFTVSFFALWSFLREDSKSLCLKIGWALLLHCSATCTEQFFNDGAHPLGSLWPGLCFFHPLLSLLLSPCSDLSSEAWKAFCEMLEILALPLMN